MLLRSGNYPGFVVFTSRDFILYTRAVPAADPGFLAFRRLVAGNAGRAFAYLVGGSFAVPGVRY